MRLSRRVKALERALVPDPPPEPMLDEETMRRIIVMIERVKKDPSGYGVKPDQCRRLCAEQAAFKAHLGID